MRLHEYQSKALFAKLRETIDEALTDRQREVVLLYFVNGLNQRQIAGRLGVCAGVEFPFPGELVQRAFGATLTLDPEERGTWGRDRLTWAVLDLLDPFRGSGHIVRLI